MNRKQTHFISCDWGTTNFRLRLVQTDTLEVLFEQSDGSGIRDLNTEFLRADTTDRYAYFANYLRQQIKTIPEAYQQLPLVVSGMASANIGMVDLPYGELPITADASGFRVENYALRDGQALYIISGVKSATGMMRGEETQALGLLELMDADRQGILLLPGTHSKHLRYRKGCFTNFGSYMTGELFELLLRQSILSNSLRPEDLSSANRTSFLTGLQTGAKDGAASHLFSIRAGDVLHQSDPGESYLRLSGLLIGDELRYLSSTNDEYCYLAGSGPLLSLYELALEKLIGKDRLTVFGAENIQRALLSGQRKIMLRND